MVQSHGPEERCIELLMYNLVGWVLLGFEEQLNNGTMKGATITSPMKTKARCTIVDPHCPIVTLILKVNARGSIRFHRLIFQPKATGCTWLAD